MTKRRKPRTPYAGDSLRGRRAEAHLTSTCLCEAKVLPTTAEAVKAGEPPRCPNCADWPNPYAWRPAS